MASYTFYTLTVFVLLVLNNVVSPAPNCSPLDIIFVITANTTLTPTTYRQKIEFVEKFVQHVNIGKDGVHVGLITEYENADVEFQMGAHLDKAELSLAIKFTYFIPGTPKFGTGLTYIRENGINSQTLAGRPNVPDVVVFLTNGVPAEYSIAQKEAKQLTKDGVTVISVGVGDVDLKDLINVASGCHYVAQATDLSKMDDLVSQTVNLTCDAFNKVPLDECECKLVADVVFLLDASESPQDKDAFQKQLKFTQNLVNEINVASNQTRVSAMTYSENIHPIFDLLSHTNKTELQTALGFLPYQGENSREVQKALAYLASHDGVLPDSLAPRDYVPKVVVVTTTGPLTDVPQATQQAWKLKNLGVTILSVGIGTANPQEATALAWSDKFAKHYQNYDDLINDAPYLGKLICQDKRLQSYATSNACGLLGPCQNGGVCLTVSGTKKCACPNGFSGVVCQDIMTTTATKLTTTTTTTTQKPTTPKPTTTVAPSPTTTKVAATTTATSGTDCTFNPCKNGGVCDIVDSFYVCKCPAGYSGVTCLDVVL